MNENQIDWQELFQKHIFEKRENPLWFLDRFFLCKWFDYGITTKSGLKFEHFTAVRGKGKFEENFDYNRGLLLVSIRTFGNSTDKYCCSISITNIDDGTWQADSASATSLEEANELTIKVKNAFVAMEESDWGYILPPEKEINDLLMKYAMWGYFCG